MMNNSGDISGAWPDVISHRISPQPPMNQQRRTDYPAIACLVLLFAYLALLPGGFVGFAIASLCLIIKLSATRNLVSLGVFMLLFGVKTMGMASLALGYPGLGGKVGIVIALLAIFFSTNMRKTCKTLGPAFVFFLWISLLLLISYFEGPRTYYSSSKLSYTVIYGILLLLAFFYLINNRSVDWFHIGQLGVLSALVCISACIILSPETKPDWFFDVGAMRIALESDTDIFENRNLIASIALLSFTILLAATPDRILSTLSVVHLIVYILVGFIFLSWAGARLPLITASAIAVTMPLLKPKYAKRYRMLSILLIGVSVFIVVYGVSQQTQFISEVINPADSFGSRVNRSLNWDAGILRFTEKPFFGHGLGGYYIRGYSFSGSGTYAHNLVLELLSETGLVGTILFFFPLIFWRNSHNFLFFRMRSQNGCTIFPIVIVLIFQSMMSFDLQTNIGLFSLICAIAVSPRMTPESIE